MPNVILRLPDDLHAEIKQSAESNMRSLNSEMLFAIAFYLKNAPGAALRAIQKGGKKKRAKEE